MKTERCEALIERDKKVISPCSHLSYFPLAVKEAKGSIITDEDGNQFIDFLSSASSLNLGSTNPVITKAIKEQLDAFTQYTPAYCYNDIYAFLDSLSCNYFSMTGILRVAHLIGELSSINTSADGLPLQLNIVFLQQIFRDLTLAEGVALMGIFLKDLQNVQ